MVIELSLGGLLTLLGIPTAVTSLGLWLLQRRISKREAVQDKREAAREHNEVLLIQNTRAALALADIPLLEDYCVEMPTLGSDDAAVHALLSRADRPTAIVVSDDLLGMTLGRACLAHGLSIPKDISIISFNNSLFAKLTSPRLTSVDLNSFQLGIEAASQLINHVERPELMATKSIIPHRIVERESCRDL